MANFQWPSPRLMGLAIVPFVMYMVGQYDLFCFLQLSFHFYPYSLQKWFVFGTCGYSGCR